MNRCAPRLMAALLLLAAATPTIFNFGTGSSAAPADDAQTPSGQ